MAQTSRRRFLAGLAAPVAGAALARVARAQGLGQFQVPTPGCNDDKPTPAAPEGPDFRKGSPTRSSLLEPGVTGTKLVLSGFVIGLTCGRIKGAIVDFWQADAHGQYDAKGFRFRGRQLTNAEGGYRLETIVPAPSGERVRRLHARIQVPGKAELTTQLFFPDDPANAKDKTFRPELVLMNVADRPDGKTASFNFILNI